jgi:Rrf2 family protein
MKTEYAIRSLIELARHVQTGPLQGSSIASRQRIPETYTELVLTELRKHGFVRSIRGSHGGFTLAVDPSQIRLGEVIDRLEGSCSPSGCTANSDECNEGLCELRSIWDVVGSQTRIFLDTFTIADLANRGPGVGSRYSI